jgi:hypothetical protein
MTMIELLTPHIGATRTRVDLDTLTPLARAYAEAFAESDFRWIRIKSRASARELFGGDANAATFYGDQATSDQPLTQLYDGWASYPHYGGLVATLEYEARKPRGWYPVALDGSDLPSTPGARADDGVTPDQCLTVLREAGLGSISKDTWMRRATKPGTGFPLPVRHNGLYSLWSERALREWARTAQVPAS